MSIGGKHRRRCGAAIAALLAILAVALTGAAVASAAAPQPTFIATSPVLKFDANGTVSTTVQVLNPTPEAQQARFELVLLPSCMSMASGAPATLVKNGVTTLSLTFKGSFDTSLTGATLVMFPSAAPIEAGAGCKVTVALTSAPVAKSTSSSNGAKAEGTSSSAGAKSEGVSTAKAKSEGESSATKVESPQPQDIVLSLRRETTLSEDFWAPLRDGVIFALFVTILTLGVTKKGPRDFKEQIKAGSSWNYKDSLATNVTAVGALLGSFLTAAGSTSTLLPGIETSRFALLSAFWGGVAIFAPLVLGFVSARVPEVLEGKPGTAVPLGLLLIVTAITLISVGAEIDTIRVLVSLAHTTKTLREVIDVSLVLAAALAGFYVLKTNGALVNSQGDPEQGPRSALNHFSESALAA